MKHYAFTVIVPLGLLAGLGWASDELRLESETDRINYSVGYQIGGDFKRQDVELNADALMRGIHDALAAAKPLMGREEVSRTLFDLKRRIVKQQREEAAKTAQMNLEQGKAFLAENAKKDGVSVRPSGLQFRVLQEGAGKTPGAMDTVTVHYRGTMIDGTEFDSSYARNQPATFAVGGVIPGWTEALQLMREGAKWELYVPPELAYGERGMGSRIPPNSTLVFEVELVSLNQPQ